jgi:phospholipid/cholesterol/gamma-HCH transport system substrate-binding protein
MIRHRVLGVAFLVLLCLAGGLTYAVFNESFSSFAHVHLIASRTGLQLPHDADVKIRGVIVGEVRGAQVLRNGVRLDLALFPGTVHEIPANVSARIEPKTLFGEKFVALQVPSSPSGSSIQPGAVIRESRVSIEVEKVLSDIYPLLRTVQPAQLNYTLTALADALDGRGEAIGRNLVTLDGYLKKTNPQIPLLVDDLHKLGSVSDTYRQVVPELSNFLRNSVTTGHTFVQEEQKIKALFDDVAAFSSTSRDFLQQNGDNIIRLSKQGQAQLPLFAKYSPEYPCLLKGIVNAIPREEQAFRGKTLHINLETLPKQPRGYNPGDSPVNADHRGPVPLGRCESGISGKFNQQHLLPKSWIPRIHDGVNYPLGKDRPAPAFDMTSGYAGTGAERSLVDGIAAPVLGIPQQRVPDVAALLFAPLARGTKVSVR